MTKLLHDIEIDNYLADCVQILPEALNEEFVRVGADLAYWNEQFSRASRRFLHTKMALEQTEARLSIQIREALNGGGARVTEAMIVSRVITDDVYTEVRLGHVEAEAEKVRLYGVLDAIRTKRDMLVSIGAQMRAEMNADPTIKNHARNKREMDAANNDTKW